MIESLTMSEDQQHRVDEILGEAEQQFAKQKANRERLFELLIPAMIYIMEFKLGVLVFLLLFKAKSPPPDSNLPEPHHAAYFLIFLMIGFYTIYRLAWVNRRQKSSSVDAE